MVQSEFRSDKSDHRPQWRESICCTSTSSRGVSVRVKGEDDQADGVCILIRNRHNSSFVQTHLVPFCTSSLKTPTHTHPHCSSKWLINSSYPEINEHLLTVIYASFLGWYSLDSAQRHYLFYLHSSFFWHLRNKKMRLNDFTTRTTPSTVQWCWCPDDRLKNLF